MKTQDAALTETVSRILDAAEIQFASHGFDGAGMKAISVQADVSQALLHYHFGSKDSLYSQVIGRRSTLINAERLKLLEQVDMASPAALNAVFEALFRPPLGPKGGAKPYARIFAGLVVGRERDRVLVKQFYDETARIFIDRINTALGRGKHSAAAQSYTLALGALAAIIGRDGRIERLMGREDQLAEVEELLDWMVTFTVGGCRALASS